MRKNNVEIRVLVKGKPITEYYHNGSSFVEGREGSGFEIEIVNSNPFRVEAVVSVDGRSVLDGLDAGVHSSGYLVEANSSLRVPGWKLNEEAVAKFVFSGKEDSYSTVMSGSSRNNGVLGAMVFAERHRRPAYTPTVTRQPLYPHHNPYDIKHFYPQGGQAFFGGTTTTYATPLIDNGLGHAWNMVQATATTSATPRMRAAHGAARGATPYGMNAVEDYYIAPSDVGGQRRTTVETLLENTVPASLNNLGCGFGKAEEFRTEVTHFERGDMIAMLVLYYDNARGLKARGIQVGRASRVKHTAQTPQAFPAANCVPPPGWRG